MNLNVLMNDPRYQRAVQKMLVRRNLYGGTGPGLGRAVSRVASDVASKNLSAKQYELAKRKADAQLEIDKERLKLRRRRIDLEQDRFDEEAAFARDQLGTAKSQGGIATALAIGGLGVKGLGGWLDMKRADNLVAAMSKMQSLYG